MSGVAEPFPLTGETSCRHVTPPCSCWWSPPALPAAAQAPQRAALTIYSHDLAFVRESRSLTLRSSRDTVRLAPVPERIDPSSVRLVPAKGRVTRLAYQFDVASGDRLLERAQGRRVRITLRENRVTEGTLVGADQAWLVVREDDGGLETLSRASVDGIRLAEPPRGLAFEADSRGGDRGAARVASMQSCLILTGGLSWSAEHRLVRTGEKTAEWSSMVTVENTSGLSFDVPRLALVAGEPHRVGPPCRRRCR